MNSHSGLTRKEREFIAIALVLLAKKTYQKKAMTAQDKRFAAKLFQLSYKLERSVNVDKYAVSPRSIGDE